MATLVVGAAVLAMVGLAVFGIIRSKKDGGCGGGCPGCSEGKCPGETTRHK